MWTRLARLHRLIWANSSVYPRKKYNNLQLSVQVSSGSFSRILISLLSRLNSRPWSPHDPDPVPPPSFPPLLPPPFPIPYRGPLITCAKCACFAYPWQACDKIIHVLYLTNDVLFSIQHHPAGDLFRAEWVRVLSVKCSGGGLLA